MTEAMHDPFLAMFIGRPQNGAVFLLFAEPVRVAEVRNL